MSGENTPVGLEPDADGVNEWVRFQLLKIHNRVKTIEKNLDLMCNRQEKFDEFKIKTQLRLAEGVNTFKSYETRFRSVDEQIKELKTIQKNNKKNGNEITFKWIIENLGTPILSSIITAIIVAALVYWITGN